MIKAVIEYNYKGCMVFAENYIGAFTRGKSIKEAFDKLPSEIEQYCKWAGTSYIPNDSIAIVKKVFSQATVQDADTEILFDSETLPLTGEEYEQLKTLAFKSAKDVMALYSSIPEKDKTNLQPRKTFYGEIPRSANEMLEHINQVTYYYLKQIGVRPTDDNPDVLGNRQKAFSALETIPDFLNNPVVIGSFEESWSLRKVLRRFIWHDRIHAKAMYRMASSLWVEIENPFSFYKNNKKAST